MIQHIDEAEEFSEFLRDNPTTLVIFTQPSWCQPCIRLAPHLETASEKTDIPFVIIGENADPLIAKDWGVMGVPKLFLQIGNYARPIDSRTSVKILAEIGAS